MIVKRKPTILKEFLSILHFYTLSYEVNLDFRTLAVIPGRGASRGENSVFGLVISLSGFNKKHLRSLIVKLNPTAA